MLLNIRIGDNPGELGDRLNEDAEGDEGSDFMVGGARVEGVLGDAGRLLSRNPAERGDGSDDCSESAAEIDEPERDPLDPEDIDDPRRDASELTNGDGRTGVIGVAGLRARSRLSSRAIRFSLSLSSASRALLLSVSTSDGEDTCVATGGIGGDVGLEAGTDSGDGEGAREVTASLGEGGLGSGVPLERTLERMLATGEEGVDGGLGNGVPAARGD